ncbi:hypothetical protein GGS24DRAFT_438636 [Hypoxylon argillaceum]|nr:hypothetical protein GGS24DRAFT_438636 [Hypoxylon argillaceum]
MCRVRNYYFSVPSSWSTTAWLFLVLDSSFSFFSPPHPLSNYLDNITKKLTLTYRLPVSTYVYHFYFFTTTSYPPFSLLHRTAPPPLDPSSNLVQNLTTDGLRAHPHARTHSQILSVCVRLRCVIAGPGRF